MSSVISIERRKVGLSQAALAERLGVSPAAVAQWEASEARGTIQLDTLAKALSGMGKKLAVVASKQRELEPVVWDCSQLKMPNPANPRQTILDAAYGNRIPAVVGECWNLGIELSVEELWLVADKISVSTTLQIWNQARAVRDSYTQFTTAIRKGLHAPEMITPDHVRIPVPFERSPEAIIEWMLLGIRNGTGWLEAYRQAGALLVENGYPWPVLLETGGFRKAWNKALDILIAVGNADPLVKLWNIVYRRPKNV